MADHRFFSRLAHAVNHADPLFRLSLGFIVPRTVVTAAFFLFVIGKGLRAQRLSVKTGWEALIGQTVDRVDPDRFARRPNFC